MTNNAYSFYLYSSSWKIIHLQSILIIILLIVILLIDILIIDILLHTKISLPKEVFSKFPDITALLLKVHHPLYVDYLKPRPNPYGGNPRYPSEDTPTLPSAQQEPSKNTY